MIRLVTLLTALFLLTSCTAQNAPQQTDSTHAVIQYSSVCCGPPSAAPVKDFVHAYERKHQLSPIRITEKTGRGMEGEFSLYIEMKNVKNRDKFLKQLKQVIEKQNSNRTNNDGFVHLSTQNHFNEEKITPLKSNKKIK